LIFHTKIHDLISNQEDLVHYPDLAYEALCRFHLIDKYINKSNQNKVNFNLLQLILFFLFDYKISFLGKIHTNF
jgi:hypothetical protein